MRNVVYIVLALALMSFGDGKKLKRKQRKELEKGKVYLELGHPQLAAPIFASLYKIDSTNRDIIFGLGQSYLAISDHQREALILLNKADEMGEVEASFYLAQAYLRAEQLDFAQRMIDRYSARGKDKDYDKVEALRATIERALKAYDLEHQWRLTLLGGEINSKFSDYVPVITRDGSVLFFTSRRPEEYSENSLIATDEDIYMTHYANGKWEQAKEMGSPVNSSTHDATVALIDGGAKLILYRTHENLSGGNLLMSVFDGKNWEEPTSFNLSINTDFQESSAWVSESGDLIYFSSNRPGGFGGKDIYRLVKLPNGEWSLPMNLGPTINSPEDEDGPFYHEESQTLYFMSAGHSTIGGFDIFSSEKNDEGVWHTVINMGLPVNSTADDIYFTMNESGTTGYFSSDRIGGYGSQDIYKVHMPYLDAYQVVRAKVLSGDDPVKAKVTLVDEDGKRVRGIYNSNAINGQFIMIFEPNKHYQIVVEAEGYGSQVKHVMSGNEDNLDEMEMKFDLEHE